MTADPSEVQLIGFENDSGLGELFAQFGVIQVYRAMLPEHLLDILRKQHPNVVIESIELLESPKCNLGGMQQEENKSLVRVQTLNVPLNLRLVLRSGGARSALDIQLVIKCDGLYSTPAVSSDMFVRSQRVLA